MLTLHHSETPAYEAGKALSSLLSKHKGSPILLLLSGGSEIGVLSHTSYEGDASPLTITVVDERCTPNDVERNFFNILQTEFIAGLKSRGASFIAPLTNPALSPEELATDLEQKVRSWIANNPQGVVMALLGIGTDGHIGGIIPPLAEEEADTERWFIAHRVSPSVNPFPSRISASFYFLEHIVVHTIVHIDGEEKRKMYEQFIVDALPRELFPAHELHAMQDVHVYTEL